MYTQSMPKIKAVLFITSLAAIVSGHETYAEMARGTSASLQVVNGEVRTGSIVSHRNGEYSLSKEPFDTEIFGVVVEDSSFSLVNPLETGSRLIMQFGEAQVLATNSNGIIKKGDYITSSTVDGIGQKADKTGYVIGKAMEDFVETGNDEPGLVWATIEPKTAFINNTTTTNLLEALRSGALSPLLSPIESLRYILAALIIAATFIIGFSTFGKSSGRTIEALGRNPLAQGTIKTAMVFNMVLAFGAMLVGLALAYLILVL